MEGFKKWLTIFLGPSDCDNRFVFTIVLHLWAVLFLSKVKEVGDTFF